MPGHDDEVGIRTGFLYEADMVANALKEAGVPHYKRVETGGIELAMPVSPAQGPGVWYLVCVPTKAAPKARQIIATLPVSRDPSPGIWAFNPTKRFRKGWQAYSLIALLLLVLILLISVISFSSEL